MATNIIHKKSSVAGKQPNDSSDLVYGELAINYQDGYLYYKDTSNTTDATFSSLTFSGLIELILKSVPLYFIGAVAICQRFSNLLAEAEDIFSYHIKLNL